MPKHQPLSLTAAAATLGITRNTLAGWISKGAPVVSRADRGRGVEWQLDVGAIFEWRVDTAVKEAVAGFQTADGGVSKEEADRRRAVALAIVAEIEADTALKSVVLVADVAEIMSDFAQAVRSGIGNAGSKIAGRACAMSNPAEIRDLCTREFNRAFDDAEQQLKDAWERGERARPDAPEVDEEETSP